MRVVRKLVDVVEQLGASRLEFLEAADIDAAQLEASEDRVPRREVHRICELALDHTRDPALGLHWGERVTKSTFVPISYLMAHAPSLGQGFESLSQFGRLLSDDPRYEIVEESDTVTIRCLPATEDESLRMLRFSSEMTMVGFFHVFRDFAGKRQPQRVSFAYPAPAYHGEYTRVFEGLERFGQPFTGIVVDRDLLKVTSPFKDEDIHDALRTVVERRMPRLPQQGPCALRVRELLVQRGWPDRVDMEIVARTLGYSVRSLRRRLAEEGKSYRAVENDAFAIVAKQRLRDEQRTIQEAAYELGFSDTTTFHRAFKRSTGTTPMKYREQQRGNARRG
jgi:AraC-like DNA-binding protein